MNLLAAIAQNERWEPGIGDPTVMGWLTVAAYLYAAVESARALWLSLARVDRERASFLLWLGVTAFLVALGINKQLDLQTYFTEVGRDLFRDHGWYENRRVAQAWFIGIIATLGLTTLAGAAWFGRHLVRKDPLAFGGALFLMTFAVIRAASFHHVDQMLGMRFVGLKVNWILELGGIALVFAGARRFRLSRSRTQSMPPLSALLRSITRSPRLRPRHGIVAFLVQAIHTLLFRRPQSVRRKL
jgi:hypothetical protein